MKFKELTFLLLGDPEVWLEKLYQEEFFDFSLEEERGQKLLKVYLRHDQDVPDFLKSEELIFTGERTTTPKDWMVSFEPFEMVDGIVVNPGDASLKDSRGKLVVWITPGLAFGTGQHPTTKMCARFLKKYVKEGDSVLDVGCGTGILAIVAKKLGASRVVAVDSDEIAVEVAMENAKKNEVEILIKKSDLLEEVEGVFDVIVSNILAEVHVRLFRDVNRVTHERSTLILSGIVSEKESLVCEKAREAGWHPVEREQEGEWIALVMKRS